MSENAAYQCDILVAGGGFAGSLMALVLHHAGFKVCLLEKEQHPRFAIGESSTPIADMMLRKLSAKYNLPWLRAFSRYGSWQEFHPEIVCGLKRGFSYFKHYPHQHFETDANHINELLVAASADNIHSDTNWLRADFDAFLVEKVKEAGIDYFDLTEIISAKRDIVWEFDSVGTNKSLLIRAGFLIDATGGGNILDKLFGVKSESSDFLTDSFAVFSHFNDVARWTDILKITGIPTTDFPYDPDDSALHQVLDEGWLWMLRFNDRRTSIGFALNGQDPSFKGAETGQIWNHMLEKYPTIRQIIKSGSLATTPGSIIRSGRLQRKTQRCFGSGWVALPHTAGFVDPLFSSGIAQSLFGLEKIAAILVQHWGETDLLYLHLKEYEHAVFEELKLIDMFVSGCYKTMPYFELFNAWSMLYFASTITCEQQLIQNKPPGYYLGADNPYITEHVKRSYAELLSMVQNGQPADQSVKRFEALIRERIAPINTAGLMNPLSKNMYRHTAAAI
jgi:tetracycline 7-halogenase / FADH2 O2-dependent halogenase